MPAHQKAIGGKGMDFLTCSSRSPGKPGSTAEK